MAGGVATGLETRHSHGLDEFFDSIDERTGLAILDFSPANQRTISLVTGFGHRLYSDDVLFTLDRLFGAQGDFIQNQENPENASRFLHETLDFPGRKFDGALVWDTLQFLSPSLLQASVERLYQVLQPGACMLAFFHAEEKVESVATYAYRLTGKKTIELVPRGRRRVAQFFNNRSLEKLFQDFHSVKFFLTRDHLREVIVRR